MLIVDVFTSKYTLLYLNRNVDIEVDRLLFAIAIGLDEMNGIKVSTEVYAKIVCVYFVHDSA